MAQSVLLATAAPRLTGRQVRLHGLAVVAVHQDGFDLYGLEGAPDRLDILTRVMRSGAQVGIVELLRRPARRGVHKRADMIVGPVTQKERAWLAEQFRQDFPERAILPSFLAWVALRQREALAGGERLAAVQANQSFPFPRFHAPRSPDGDFLSFQ